MGGMRKSFELSGTSQTVKTTNPTDIEPLSENRAIEEVKILLNNESYLATVDSTFLEDRKDFERDTGLKHHPMYSKCLVSCVLFKQICVNGRDYALWAVKDVPSTVKGKDRNGVFRRLKVTANHYFLKHIKTGKVIDITKEQFFGSEVPYHLGRRVTSERVLADGKVMCICHQEGEDTFDMKKAIGLLNNVFTGSDLTTTHQSGLLCGHTTCCV